MNRALILGAGFALGLGILAGAAPLASLATARQQPTWHSTYAAAQAAARQAGKPIFLVFR